MQGGTPAAHSVDGAQHSECSTVYEVLIMGAKLPLGPCCPGSEQHAAAAVVVVVVVVVSYFDLSEAKCWKVEEIGQVSVSLSNSAPSPCLSVCAQRGKKKKTRIICPLRLMSTILCSLRPGGSPCLCSALSTLQTRPFLRPPCWFLRVCQKGGFQY